MFLERFKSGLESYKSSKSILIAAGCMCFLGVKAPYRQVFLLRIILKKTGVIPK